MKSRSALSLCILLVSIAAAWGQAIPEPLIGALGDRQNLSARQQAINQIADLGPPAIDQLKSVLDTADAWTRIGAAEALGRIQDERATAILIQVLETGEKNMRVAAAKALGGQANARAVDALMLAVHIDTPQHADVKIAAIRSLGEINDPRSGMFLVRVIASQMHPGCAHAAADSLKKMTGHDFGRDLQGDLKWIAENRPDWQKMDPKKKGLSRGYLSLWVALGVFAVLGFGAVIKGWRNYR